VLGGRAGGFKRLKAANLGGRAGPKVGQSSAPVSKRARTRAIPSKRRHAATPHRAARGGSWPQSYSWLSGEHMNTLLMLQYLTLTLFAVNAALGLARAIARGTTRAFARQCVESFMVLFVLITALHSFGLMGLS
jgi:hypothetical protein